ncbi:MAG: ABC transporter ATP-binding protein [Tissierellia bacterium]|nr:ABC transporter ATP-binding protein [Tissierellia bacterium]
MENKYKDIKKSGDIELIKRLLEYSRPYFKYMFFVLILLLLVTVLQLLSPYLVKTVIDDHLSVQDRAYYGYDIENLPQPFTNSDTILFNGKHYISETELDKFDYEKPEAEFLATENGNHYLVKYDDGFGQNKNIESRIAITKDEYASFRSDDINGIQRIGIFYLITIFALFIINYAQSIILTIISQKIIFNVRNDLFYHIQGSAIGYFDNQAVGRLVSRVTNDTEAVNEFYNEVLISLFKDIFYIGGIIIVLVKLHGKLSIIVFLLTPLILIASFVFRKVIRELYRIAKEQHSRITAKLNETITGIRIVQIFGKENKVFNQFDELNTDYSDTSIKQIKVHGLFRPVIEMIKALGISAIIYFGGGMVIQEAIEFGVLFLYIDYIKKLFRPIMDLTDKYNIMQSAMASSERIFGILDTDYNIQNTDKPVSTENVKGKIEFKDVWFAYDNEDWVLKGISFTINEGENIAIVGSTGAGKSTIINLITRFYDIQSGEILLDGINIKDYDKYELRKKIGVVLQDVFMFTGTIADNITLGDPEMELDDIEAIAKYVNASHFIERLPDKFNQTVVERGATLSSGERQLLSFARTLAYEPVVLILDEATSSIDTESELLIQDALTKITKDRTTISIAHRLSTIQNSDRIIVLNHGEIFESGTHQELLDKRGMYYDLYTLQYQE